MPAKLVYPEGGTLQVLSLLLHSADRSRRIDSLLHSAVPLTVCVCVERDAVEVELPAGGSVAKLLQMAIQEGLAGPLAAIEAIDQAGVTVPPAAAVQSVPSVV